MAATGTRLRPRERLFRRPLVVLAVSYFSCLLVISTTPLFLDPAASSYIAIGPLLFEVLLTAYLAIRYLGLKSIFRLSALFLALIGLVSVPSGILLSAASGQHYYPAGSSGDVTNLTSSNSTLRWANIFDGPCIQAHGESSTSTPTNYLGLGYSGTGYTLGNDCYGAGHLTSEAYASGTYGKTLIQSRIWFEDKQFYVPNIHQHSSLLYVGGIIHATGWLAVHTAGVGIYQSGATLNAIVRISGTAPCNLDNNCYASYYVVQTWTGFMTIDNDFTFSGLTFNVAPGYLYKITVSFNETSYVEAVGAGGIANSDACFGYASYCTSSPDIGPTLICSPTPSSSPSCGLAVKQLSYTLTNV